MKKTYRKWVDTNEVFFIKNFDDEEQDYYCEAEWWADSFYFDKDYIEKESIEATQEEIEAYKINKAKYN